MKNPLISIIMPTYNCELYISKAVNSVLSQTYIDWELIIIDDGSTDRTQSIAQQYAERDSRIKFFKNASNIGVAKTRARAADIATAQWIAFLDSDDYWLPNKLEKQMRLVNQDNSASFIYTASAFIDEDDNMYKWVMPVSDSVTYKELLKQNIITCSSVLLRKELLPENDILTDSIHEDFAMWLSILRSKLNCAHGINEPLVVYRIRRQSKSGNKIKSAVMTYKTYRAVGLDLLASAYYMIFYLVHGIIKYSHIKL